MQGHTQPVISLAFSPDGGMFASGSMDTSIVLWDAATGKRIGDPLQGHQATVNALAFSPDGETLASVGCAFTDEQFCAGSELILWDLSQRPVSCQVLPVHGHNVYAMTFSPDGATLATGSNDETIRLWDVASGAQVGDPISGHENGVTSLAFSPDGRLLASGGLDAVIFLTDLESRQRLGPPLAAHNDVVSSLAFSPSGAWLASASHDSNVFLWSMELSSWIDHACLRAGRNLSQAEWQSYFPGDPYKATCSDLPAE